MPAYDDGSTPTLATEKPPAIAVRTAQTGANGSGVGEELAHAVDTTGPEAVVYAVRMRAGCAGGQGCVGTGRSQWHFGNR